MTTDRPIILRELPATKTADPVELARAAPYRYSAEWETPEGIDDETDPMLGAVGFGESGAAAHADLVAQTARNCHRQSDEEIRDALGGLAEDLELMNAAIARAERYASIAFNAAEGEPDTSAGLLVQNGQAWTDTAAALRRLLAATSAPPRILTAESDEDRAQRLAALDAMLDNTLSQEKTTRQPGESDEQRRARIMAAAPKLRDAIIEALADLNAFDYSDGQDHLAPGRAADTLRRALNPDPTQENPDADR